MTETKRLKEIDSLYAIGIILVLIGHSHSSNWGLFRGTILHWLIEYIYTFHMALFFFIAGFLFINSRSFEHLGFRLWLRNKATRLLIPYCFWSFIALVPKYYAEHHSLSGLSLRSILWMTVNPRAGVWGHFWFLPVLFILYFFFGIWRSFLKSKNEKQMVCFSVALSIIISYLPIETDFWGLADVKKMMVYFSLGIAANSFAINRVWRKKSVIIWIWSIITAICCGMLKDLAYRNVFLGQIIAVLMILACWSFACMIPENSIFQWISRNHYTIYIFSWFFQAIVMMICDRLQLHWFLTFWAMFSAGIIGAAIVVCLSKYKPISSSRFLKLLVGTR